MANNPIARFDRWFKQAQRAHAVLPEAMALATADAQGRPSVRFVLLKQGNHQGFVFFTNARSAKGRQLRANPRASAVLYWDAIGKQVRIDGRIEEVTTAEADAYWETRSREKQLAALASEQSAPLASRSALVARWKKLQREYRHQPIPRPHEWVGFRIIPDAVEFWHRGEHRLHDRELYVRTRGGWKRTRLQP